jgi:hypothetical protein
MQHRLYYIDTDTSRCSTKDEDRDTQVQHRLLYRQTRPGAAQRRRQAHTGTAQALVWTDTSRCSTKDADRHTQVQHKPLYRQTRPDETQVAVVNSKAESAKISAGIFKQIVPARQAT